MHGSLLQQGLDLLIFGMGTVFVFLTVLVISVGLMSKIIARFFAEIEETPRVAPTPVRTTTTAAAVDPNVLLAIQEAIYQHRAKHQR